MAAIDEGDPDYVETILNKKDESGIHPLFLSVFAGNLDLTKLLLENGADPMKASDPRGATLLHICAERGYEDLCALICVTSPELVFEQDLEGNTAVHVVCDWDYIEIVKNLCDVVDSHLEKMGGGTSVFKDTEGDDSDEQ